MKRTAAALLTAFLCGTLAAQKVTVNVEGRGAGKDALVPVTVEWNDAWFEPFEKP